MKTDLPGSGKYALIMAAGSGLRAKSEMPKQFVELLGIPMLWWSVMAFHKEDAGTRICVVVSEDYLDFCLKLRSSLPEPWRSLPLCFATGGATRGESVRRGLKACGAAGTDLVAVHDAARPLVSPALIARAWDAAHAHGAGCPVVPVTDSLRELDSEGGSHTVDRLHFAAVQTPQTARADLLQMAYEVEERPEFTDDASRLEAAGANVELFEGEATNIKVTNPMDFAIASLMLKARQSD